MGASAHVLKSIELVSGSMEFVTGSANSIHGSADRKLPSRYNEKMPSVVPIPRILLIDSDARFSYSFRKVAGQFHVPVRTFGSVLALNEDLPWEYDLVLLDLDTVSSEFMPEIVADIKSSYGRVPVLAIGKDEPEARDDANWSKIVDGFSNKIWGVTAVFNDAIEVFTAVTYKPKTHLSRVK